MHVASFMKVGGGGDLSKNSRQKKEKKRKRKSLLQIVKTLIFFFGGGDSILYVKLQFTFNFTVHFFPFTSFLHAPKKKGGAAPSYLTFFM